jgi:hypothetical protein
VKPVDVGGKSFLLQGGNPVAKDEGTDVWLIPHNSSNSPDYTGTLVTNDIKFFWGSDIDSSGNTLTYNASCNGSDVTPAVEFIVYYGTWGGSSITSASEYHFIKDSCGRVTSTNPSDIVPTTFNNTISGYKNNFKWTTTITNAVLTQASPLKAYLIKVIPLYNQAIIGVNSATDLSSQGKEYISTGVSGNTQRTISYYRGYPVTPPGLYLLYQN